jgi:hypothetical protein
VLILISSTTQEFGAKPVENTILTVKTEQGCSFIPEDTRARLQPLRPIDTLTKPTPIARARSNRVNQHEFREETN